MATRTADSKTFRGVVVQSFRTETDATEAIRDLQAAGFTSDDISVVAKDKEVARGVAADTGTEAAEGAATGLVAGGVLGGVVAALAGASAIALPGVGWVIGGTLAGVLIGGAAGAITGGLIGMGIPEHEAKHYNERYKSGDVIVTVIGGEREAEARRILQRDSTTDFGSGYDLARRGSVDVDRVNTTTSTSTTTTSTGMNRAGERLGDLDATTGRGTGLASDADTVAGMRGDVTTDERYPG
jgi:hypothetical protein